MTSFDERIRTYGDLASRAASRVATTVEEDVTLTREDEYSFNGCEDRGPTGRNLDNWLTCDGDIWSGSRLTA